MVSERETQCAEGPEPDAEIRAINERLVIAAVRQQELAEAARESAESARRSEALYRLLAENFPNGMVLLFDHSLRHVLAAGRGLAALGLSKEALEGATIWEGFTPQTCRQIEPAYRAALSGEARVLEVRFSAGTAFQEIQEREWPEREEQGQGERVYQIHTLPVRDDRGDVFSGMAVAQDVTEQRQMDEAIRWLAHHDALTGLPNRALLRDRLEQVLAISERSGERAALLFLDLDDFKRVNDTWGHAAGDCLLQSVASRLSGCLRAEDTVARLAGDEFVVLLPSLHAAGDAAGVAQKIAAALAAPMPIGGHELTVTASIGISLFPDDGRDSGALMKAADSAMYQCKASRVPR